MKATGVRNVAVTLNPVAHVQLTDPLLRIGQSLSTKLAFKS